MIADSDDTHLMKQFITTQTPEKLLSALSDRYNLKNSLISAFALKAF